jgi:hypothetical protein
MSLAKVIERRQRDHSIHRFAQRHRINRVYPDTMGLMPEQESAGPMAA